MKTKKYKVLKKPNKKIINKIVEKKISCVNCTKYCQNNDTAKLINMIINLKEEGYEKLIVSCEANSKCLDLLIRSLNLVKTRSKIN